jgi:DNA-binding IclR family transcriptional regulator
MPRANKDSNAPTRSGWGTGEPQYSQSLDRGLAILKCFTSDQQAIGIAALADQLHGSRSTTHRYACTLVELGYLEQDSSRKYRLGGPAADVGLAVIGAMPIHQHAQPVLKQLRLATNYTVCLGILDDEEVLYLDVLRGSRSEQHAVDLDLGVGTRAPLHCTAIGKALLAALPGLEQSALVDQLSLSQPGPNTIASKKALRRALGDIREEGLAVDDEESTLGAQAIAAAVMATDSDAIGAISLIAPRSSTTIDQLRSTHGAALVDTASRLAMLLG